MGAVVILLIVSTLAVTGWRFGADSRIDDRRDRYWWPKGCTKSSAASIHLITSSSRG